MANKYKWGEKRTNERKMIFVTAKEWKNKLKRNTFTRTFLVLFDRFDKSWQESTWAREEEEKKLIIGSSLLNIA